MHYQRSSLSVERFRGLWESFNLPCLFIGDFNEVLSPINRGSQFFSTNGSNDFQMFLQDLQLIEIPLSNGWFTWHSGSSKSKLDRLFCQQRVGHSIPQLDCIHPQKKCVWSLSVISEIINQKLGSASFSVPKLLVISSGCLKAIKDAWARANHLPISEKTKEVKSSLKSWNMTDFGSIDTHISTCEEKI